MRLFSKYTSVYYWIRDCITKIIVLQGGTSSSKTISALQDIIHLCLKQYGMVRDAEDKAQPYTASVVAESWPTLSRGALRDFKFLLSQSPELRKNLINPNLERGPFKFKNGSVLEFITVTEKNARHGKRDLIFFNEVNNLSKKIVDDMIVRTRVKAYMDFNSDSKFWVHKHYVHKKNVTYCISNFTHNQYIPPEILADILEKRVSWLESISEEFPEGKPALRNDWIVYGLGKTGVPHGAIYTEVNWIPILPLDLKYESYFIDWGFQIDPLAMGKAGIYRGEIYAKQLIYETKLLTSDLIIKLRKMGLSRNDLIVCDNSDPESIATLRKAGFNAVPFNKKQNKKSKIKDLRSKKINITLDSIDWVSEQENYKWKIVQGEYTDEVQDGDDHLWDGLLYWYHYLFGVDSKRKTPKQNTRQIKRIR